MYDYRANEDHQCKEREAAGAGVTEQNFDPCNQWCRDGPGNEIKPRRMEWVLDVTVEDTCTDDESDIADDVGHDDTPTMMQMAPRMK